MNLIFKLMGWAFVIGMAGMIGIWVLPGVLLGLALVGLTVKLARPAHRWSALLWQYVTGRRPGGWGATFGAVASLGVIGWSAVWLVHALRGTAAGNSERALDAAVAGVIVLGGLALFHRFAKRERMPDIFQLASDPSALEAFVSNSPGPAARSPLPQIDPDKLAELVRRDVIGQDPIVREVSQKLARGIRIARPTRPLGVFLFVGATGAGKTELAKALAKYGFEGRITRVDCNELTESHAAQRLIGAPPGYIGSEQGGQLTRAIMQLGSGVILLDEIEKAHESVRNMVMSLMDEGRLTEASTGNVADASQFVVVMTSNAEHARLAEIATSVSDETARNAAMKDALSSVFKPEQLSRMDVCCFAPLGRRDLVQVVGKFLQHFAAESGVELAAVDTALLVETVLQHEKGAKYGIRELVRLIERAIVDGMLDRRDEGFRRVAIRCEGDSVRVVGIPQGVDAAAHLASLPATATARA